MSSCGADIPLRLFHLCDLHQPRLSRTLKAMEVHFNSDLQAKLDKLATETGRATNELVEEVVAGYFDELAQTRQMLDSRYDDLKSGRTEPIDGEEFFDNLRRREDELLKKHSSQ
jgi:predicted transcriptional regulator